MNKWWDAKKGVKHESIFQVINQMEANDKARANRMLVFARLYNNIELMGLDPYTYAANTIGTVSMDDTIDSLANTNERLRYNVIASIIDTLAARISINTPNIKALPKKGDYDIHRAAEKLEQFLEGVFYDAGVIEIAQKMFLHAACFGTGIMRPIVEDGNLKVEWVLPSEIKVDPAESMYGKPRQMHRIKYVDRAVLIERFPEFESEILAASVIDQNYTRTITTKVSDLVTIAESWHLPSSPDSKDGRHVVSLNTVDLLDEEYEDNDFPFVFMHWREPMFGFWGRGVSENILQIQIEINTILQRIQEALFLCSNPITWVNTASSISTPQITNEIGVVVGYTGAQPPATIVGQSVAPETFQHLERLIQMAHESEGVSMMSTQSKNILGPNASGAAIRELADLESGRFGKVSRAYQQCFVDLAKKVIKLAAETFEDDDSKKYVVRGQDFIETIAWEDINLDEAMYVLELGASSSLPETKAGRTQTAIEWLQMGAITMEEFREIVSLGDVDADTKLRLAPREYVQKVVDDILDFGIVTEPEKYDDLKYALQYSLLTYNKARVDGLAEDRVDLLAQYIDKIKTKIKMIEEVEQQKQLAAQPPQGLPPEAQAPTPPPQLNQPPQ